MRTPGDLDASRAAGLNATTAHMRQLRVWHASAHMATIRLPRRLAPGWALTQEARVKLRTPVVLAIAAALTAIAPVATCTGVTGWDGPTGVGVPNGLAAF